MSFIFNPVDDGQWPHFYLETEKCKVLDFDRQKAGSMSDGSDACQRSEKGVELPGTRLKRAEQKILVLGIASGGCMAQVLVLAFGLFRLLWLALVFGKFRV